MIRAVLSGGLLGRAYLLGADAFLHSLARFTLKLEANAGKADEAAGDEMVELMRSRVPVDSGRLLNGITSRRDGNTIIVEASALRGDFDYARAIEFGHGVSHGDPLGPPRPRRSRAKHGGRAEAEPFFLSSAEEVLEERGKELSDAVGQSAEEAGL